MLPLLRDGEGDSEEPRRGGAGDAPMAELKGKPNLKQQQERSAKMTRKAAGMKTAMKQRKLKKQKVQMRTRTKRKRKKEKRGKAIMRDFVVVAAEAVVRETVDETTC